MEQNVVDTLPYGLAKLIEVEGTAAATTLTVRPTEGKRWRVLDCYGYHDDNVGGPYNCAWSFYDGTIQMGHTIVSVANGVNVELVRNAIAGFAIVGPVILTYETYTIFQADGMGAGKKLWAKLLVLEYEA